MIGLREPIDSGRAVDTSTSMDEATAGRLFDVSNKIFYFTGSGNSLAIARAIADGLGETEIVPIARSMDGFEGRDEERVGIVSPVFAWGPPRMVVEFLGRFHAKPDQYVFAICDSGGTQGTTLHRIRKLLRSAGTRLDAGFAVRGDFLADLPGMEDMGIIRFIQRIVKRVAPHFAERRDELIRAIRAKKSQTPETNNLSVNLIGSIMHGGAMNMFKKADRDFRVSDACVSCGTCARVCPRENVRLVDGRPTWHQDCEMCYACMLWCPQSAISVKGNVPTEPRHHPDVALDDMLLR